MFKYEFEVAGFGSGYKKMTNNVQKTFTDFANKLDGDIPCGGSIFFLRKGDKEAQLSMSSKKMRLFRNNENTRLVTEQFLLDQF